MPLNVLKLPIFRTFFGTKTHFSNFVLKPKIKNIWKNVRLKIISYFSPKLRTIVKKRRVKSRLRTFFTFLYIKKIVHTQNTLISLRSFHAHFFLKNNKLCNLHILGKQLLLIFTQVLNCVTRWNAI